MTNNAFKFWICLFVHQLLLPTICNTVYFTLLAEVALTAEATQLILRGISEGCFSQAIPLYIVRGN